MDINEICEYLFYCYFFLLVDWVVELDIEGKCICVYKNVSINELFFNGYFFEYLIMLGVLIIEVMVQVVGIFGFKMFDVKFVDGIFYYFVGLDKLCFCQLVLLGD